MDNKSKTGAVRSSDSDLYAWSSLPWIALIAVARTGGEGRSKYGANNYKRGMPADQYFDHIMTHLALHRSGDRSQPNLAHAAWGMLAMIESELLHPELNVGTTLGPGATVTPEMIAHMDAEAPALAAFRKTDAAKTLGNWRLEDLPEIAQLLAERAAAQTKGRPFADTDHDAVTLEMAEFLKTGELVKIGEAELDAEIPDDVKREIEEYAAGMVADEQFDSLAFMEEGRCPTIDPHDSLLAVDGQLEKFRVGLEHKLAVTKDDMEAFEATKLQTDSDEDRSRRLQIDRTEAAAYEARLAAGWAVTTEQPGTIETQRFRREEGGKMTLIGHTVTFSDGSQFDRIAEEAVPDSAPEESRGGSAALYRKIHAEKERQRDLDNQAKADAAYAEWVASEAQKELDSLSRIY